MNNKNNILFFDGVCNLCNSFIRYVHRRDKKHLFLYQSLQSEQAKQTLKLFNYSIEEDMKSFVLLHDNRIYTKSSAFLKVMQLLGFPYSIFQFFYITPKPIRDEIYSYIAKNRYKWFGKTRDVCEYDSQFQEKIL